MVDLRRGGERPCRDKADTNYGAHRPREGMAKGFRQAYTILKMTRGREKQQASKITIVGGGGSSAAREEYSGNFEFEITAEKFWISPSAVSGVTAGQVLDGARTTFQLLNVPEPNTVTLAMNGQMLTEGVDYSMSGDTITWLIADPAAPPAVGILSGSYWRSSD